MSTRPSENDGPRLTNFSKAYVPLEENDIEICVMGFGKRFPCQHAWIMSVQHLEPFVDVLKNNYIAVNQNTFLPGTCNVFSFSVFGALAMSVKVLDFDRAFEEIANDEATEPFNQKSWAFLHFQISDNERKRIAEKMDPSANALKKATAALVKSVQAKKSTAPGKRWDGSRVTLSGTAKKHFKKLGYVWNKAESRPRVTVFDKVTEQGNIIRINADSGGHNELIPYIDATFIGTGFVSSPIFFISIEEIRTEADLIALLEKHTDDLRNFEVEIASVYDRIIGRCPPTITRLLQEQRVRGIR